jgi:hypothetical protein
MLALKVASRRDMVKEGGKLGGIKKENILNAALTIHMGQ